LRQRVSSRAGRPLAVSRQSRPDGRPPNKFAVFGEGLSSPISFPELPSYESGPVAWTLKLVERGELPKRENLLGFIPGLPCRVELHRAGAEGFVLSHSCTGAFDVRGKGGADIRFARNASAPADLIRADILGRVLALAMHMTGMLSLHASAVVMQEGAIAFIAPKGSGKSTLALSLAREGARFLTDDVLPVRADEPFIVNPGVQSVRLPNESALRLIGDGVKRRLGIDGKHIVDRLPTDMMASGPASLVAMYVLSQSRNGRESVVSRSRLSARQTLPELVRHAKIGALLGGSEARKVFQQAAAVASAVPAYSLEIARDLHLLPDAVAEISRWHGGVCTTGR
jgi:hypothetical protein